MTFAFSPDRVAQHCRHILNLTVYQADDNYLEPGTSLFETLDTITAAEASQPVSATCASIAAQTAHVRFLFDYASDELRDELAERYDWGEAWRTVEAVTTDEWETSKAQLRASYEILIDLMREPDTWRDEDTVFAALSTLAHTAYHLGEIRQALCTIRTNV